MVIVDTPLIVFVHTLQAACLTNKLHQFPKDACQFYPFVGKPATQRGGLPVLEPRNVPLDSLDVSSRMLEAVQRAGRIIKQNNKLYMTTSRLRCCLLCLLSFSGVVSLTIFKLLKSFKDFQSIRMSPKGVHHL